MAAYCDLTTGMVLCSGSPQKIPQEALDQLGLSAMELLCADFGLGQPIQNALVMQDWVISLVVRSMTQPNEALACECNLDIDLPAFTQDAGQMLAGFGK